MDRGSRAVHAFSWAQTDVEGTASAPFDMVEPGVVWRWRGEAVRLDGPQGLLPLGNARGADEIRARAARAVRRWLKHAPPQAVDEDDTPAGRGFTVTDGRRLWIVTLVETGTARPPLAVIAGDLPPRNRDLWVVQGDMAKSPEPVTAPMVCFTRGTLILCADGLRPVEDITPGMQVQTRDNGCQEVLRTASRRIGGARLQVEPALAPVRMRTDGGDITVSPDHRLLLRGPRALALFNCDEVLAAARDLVDGRHIRVLRGLGEVHYHHLLLPRHEIILANGIEAESLLPSDAALLGEATCSPDATPARRLLSRGEALIAAQAA